MNQLKNFTISAVSLWLGVMGFFSFLAAPALFATLDRESAGRLVTALLPRYYLFGIVMETLALGGVVGRVVLTRRRQIEWGPLVLLLLMLALTLYSLLVLLPQAEGARQAMRSAPAGMLSEAALAFGRAHRLSVVLNLLTMLAGLTLVFVEGLGARR
jgi:hypothetical protein